MLESERKEKAPGRSLTCTFMPDWQDILSIKLQKLSLFLQKSLAKIGIIFLLRRSVQYQFVESYEHQ